VKQNNTPSAATLSVSDARNVNCAYKWIATKGPRFQATVGVGFFTKADAQAFASRENRRHDSGYYVARVSEVINPRFN